jgi:hypothetical protein
MIKKFKDFDKEMKYLQDTITSLKCYLDIKNSVPNDKKHNWNGSTINRILCMYENQVLQSCISALNKRNIKICALMFDGIMPYGDYYDDNELLELYKSFRDVEIINMSTYVSEFMCELLPFGLSKKYFDFERTKLSKLLNKKFYFKIVIGRK